MASALPAILRGATSSATLLLQFTRNRSREMTRRTSSWTGSSAGRSLRTRSSKSGGDTSGQAMRCKNAASSRWRRGAWGRDQAIEKSSRAASHCTTALRRATSPPRAACSLWLDTRSTALATTTLSLRTGGPPSSGALDVRGWRSSCCRPPCPSPVPPRGIASGLVLDPDDVILGQLPERRRA